MLTVGSQGVYAWLVTDEDFDLLQLCPEVAVGKYVAVTSIDSGQFLPTEKETAAGWQTHGGIAYSPKIQHAEELPREGWDEWYIFENPSDLGRSHLAENIFEVPQEQGHVSVFVNYFFALHRPEMKDLADLTLSGHRKTGHLWTGQNRPLDSAPDGNFGVPIRTGFFV